MTDRQKLAAGSLYAIGCQPIYPSAIPVSVLPGRYRVAGLDDGAVGVSQQTLQGDVVVYDSAGATIVTVPVVDGTEVGTATGTGLNIGAGYTYVSTNSAPTTTATVAVASPWSWVFDARAKAKESLIVDLRASTKDAVLECWSSVAGSSCDGDGY